MGVLEICCVNIFDCKRSNLPCTLGLKLLEINTKIQMLIQVKLESSFAHELSSLTLTLISRFLFILLLLPKEIVVDVLLTEVLDTTLLFYESVDMGTVIFFGNSLSRTKFVLPHTTDRFCLHSRCFLLDFWYQALSGVIASL